MMILQYVNNIWYASEVDRFAQKSLSNFKEHPSTFKVMNAYEITLSGNVIEYLTLDELNAAVKSAGESNRFSRFTCKELRHGQTIEKWVLVDVETKQEWNSLEEYKEMNDELLTHFDSNINKLRKEEHKIQLKILKMAA